MEIPMPMIFCACELGEFGENWLEKKCTENKNLFGSSTAIGRSRRAKCERNANEAI